LPSAAHRNTFRPISLGTEPRKLTHADSATVAQEACCAQPPSTCSSRPSSVPSTDVEWHEQRRRRRVAEQRDHLLTRSTAPYVLFLDDDVWLEPWSLEAIERLGCGFVG
jgi:hypothetical protein